MRPWVSAAASPPTTMAVIAEVGTPATVVIAETHAAALVTPIGTQGLGSPSEGSGYFRTNQVDVARAPRDTTTQDGPVGETISAAKVPTMDGSTANAAKVASARITIATRMSNRITTASGGCAASSSDGTEAIKINGMGDGTRRETDASNGTTGKMHNRPGRQGCNQAGVVDQVKPRRCRQPVVKG